VRAPLLFLLAIAGCYDLPKPECGFVCGDNGACPADYTCNAADNRCHREGSPLLCATGIDAGPPAPVDRTPPEVLMFTPANDARDVLLGTKLTVVFSERVVGASPTTIRLELGGQPVDIAVEFDLPTRIATITPTSPLQMSTFYTATVTTGLIDLAGNPPVGETIWTFQTSRPPELLGTTPPSNALGVGVDTNVSVSFDEEIFGVTSANVVIRSGTTVVAGALSVLSMNKLVTFNPTFQLAADTDHTVTLTQGITDAVANSLGGAPRNWSFRTGPDTVAPAVLSRFPVVDRTDVSLTSLVIVGFDEVVTVDGTGFTVAPIGGVPIAATIVASSGGRAARLTPAVPLDPATTYVVTLTSAIVDGAGNALPPETWTFMTMTP